MMICQFLASGAGADPSPAAATRPAASQPAIAIDPELDAWLDRIEKRATAILTIRAKLSYVRVQRLLRDEQRRSGTLDYAAGPPAQFAIHFKRLVIDDVMEPISLRYIFDGRWLADRNDDEKMFIRHELVADDGAAEDLLKLGQGPFPVPLNLRKDRLLRRFDVTLLQPPAPGLVPPESGPDNAPDQEPPNSVHLRLVPKPHVQVRQTQIEMWFDRATCLPVRVRAVNAKSQTETIVNLHAVQVDEELVEQVFDTAPPPERGWEVQINLLDNAS